MSESWSDGVVEWWIEEVHSDPVYSDEVIPLLLDVLAPMPGWRYLDLGCGEGSVMRAVTASGASVIGCDLSERLGRTAARVGAVAVCRLPDLSWVRSGALDGAYAVLVLEHLSDIDAFFEEAARAVRSSGALALVANHPAFTAPESGPIVDMEDGEVLWRWGPYLEMGSSEEPAGPGTVVFHPRPMGRVLEAAASAGWSLQRLVETGVGDARAAADPLLAAQRQIPRLMGARWVRA
jgi:SAM-dependent methyltransferase